MILYSVTRDEIGPLLNRARRKALFMAGNREEIYCSTANRLLPVVRHVGAIIDYYLSFVRIRQVQASLVYMFNTDEPVVCIPFECFMRTR